MRERRIFPWRTQQARQCECFVTHVAQARGAGGVLVFPYTHCASFVFVSSSLSSNQKRIKSNRFFYFVCGRAGALSVCAAIANLQNIIIMWGMYARLALWRQKNKEKCNGLRWSGGVRSLRLCVTWATCVMAVDVRASCCLCVCVCV
jgi:hypothetical protein